MAYSVHGIVGNKRRNGKFEEMCFVRGENSYHELQTHLAGCSDKN